MPLRDALFAWRYVWRVAPRSVLLHVAARSALAVATALVPLWVKLLVDGEWAVAAVMLAASAAVVPASGTLLNRHYMQLAERFRFAFDDELATIARTAPLEHLERPETLDRLQVLDQQKASMIALPSVLAGTVALGFESVATLVLLAATAPAALVLPAFAAVPMAASAASARIAQRTLDRVAEDARTRADCLALATSAQAGKELRVFGLEDEIVSRYERAASSVIRGRTSGAVREALVGAGGWAVFAAGFALVVAATVRGGRRGAGDVALLLTLGAQVNAQLRGAATIVSGLAQMLATTRRLAWAKGLVPSSPAEGVVPPAALRDGIRLEDVSFAYPGSDRTVLDRVTLHVPAGSALAIVGENGAGKTTLVKLLCGMYEPTRGRIVVDGSDLAALDGERWRAATTACFQDFARPEFLAGQVVGLGDVARIDEFGEALERAAAQDVVAHLPRGASTQLGRSFDDGHEPSGGQWQKLALARSMMRREPLLLVLDEPTASLDAQSERVLYERFAALRRSLRNGGVTVLVSHRFSTVRTADAVVVLDGGRVVEQGTHDELVAHGGLYAELYELQARGYR